MRTSCVLALAFASAFSTNSVAADFKCEVTAVQRLGNTGLLEAIKSEAAEFSVNRATGLITGAGLTNAMSGQRPTVYNDLPDENGFKAITIYKPHYTVDYLEIQEWQAGKKKPFIYKSAFGQIYTGLCSGY